MLARISVHFEDVSNNLTDTGGASFDSFEGVEGASDDFLRRVSRLANVNGRQDVDFALAAFQLGLKEFRCRKIHARVIEEANRKRTAIF